MNINYHDLYYTVIKNKDEKDIVNDKDNENEINHNISIKPRDTILR